jgi:hypothetical protein
MTCSNLFDAQLIVLFSFGRIVNVNRYICHFIPLVLLSFEVDASLYFSLFKLSSI